MKKPLYSAKPGQIINEEGEKRPVYMGKPRTIKNLGRYLTKEDSEIRRQEVKEEIREKTLIKKVVNYFKEQVEVENCRLCEKLINNQIKKIDNHC